MRLERSDAYLTRFEAKVLEVDTDHRGTWLRLARSAFYATGGGQPHDTGELGGIRVLDVESRGSDVWHLLAEGEGPSAGDEIEGRISWPRRYTHLQRHSGQHLLSQAFLRVGTARGVVEDGLPGFHTRSVSMRSADCTLDLTGTPDQEALAEAELEVNRAARLAMPVLTFEVDDSRLADYRLRRPTKVTGVVRLVAMGDYDIVACGGTHVRNTAEVLPVKLLGAERVRGGLTRVTFRAGEEALSDHVAKHSVLHEVSPLLSAPFEEVPARIRALMDRVSELQSVVDAARTREAEQSAERLLGGAESPTENGFRLLIETLPEDQAELFEPLIDRLQREPRCVALLAVRVGTGARLAFVAGPESDADVRPALQAALTAAGGRGGGRPDRAQGALPGGADLEAALAAAAKALGP